MCSVSYMTSHPIFAESKFLLFFFVVIAFCRRICWTFLQVTQKYVHRLNELSKIDYISKLFQMNRIFKIHLQFNKGLQWYFLSRIDLCAQKTHREWQLQTGREQFNILEKKWEKLLTNCSLCSMKWSICNTPTNHRTNELTRHWGKIDIFFGQTLPSAMCILKLTAKL